MIYSEGGLEPFSAGGRRKVFISRVVPSNILPLWAHHSRRRLSSELHICCARRLPTRPTLHHHYSFHSPHALLLLFNPAFVLSAAVSVGSACILLHPLLWLNPGAHLLKGYSVER